MALEAQPGQPLSASLALCCCALPLALCSLPRGFATSTHIAFLILLILHRSAKGSLPWKSSCTHKMRSGSFVIYLNELISFFQSIYLNM